MTIIVFASAAEKRIEPSVYSERKNKDYFGFITAEIPSETTWDYQEKGWMAG